MAVSKTWVNFWLAVAMTANGACLLLTGLLLRWAVPGGPGRGGGDSFLWRSCHDWRDLHYHLALLFVALVVIHVLTHWRWISGRLQDLRKG